MCARYAVYAAVFPQMASQRFFDIAFSIGKEGYSLLGIVLSRAFKKRQYHRLLHIVKQVHNIVPFAIPSCSAVKRRFVVIQKRIEICLIACFAVEADIFVKFSFLRRPYLPICP